MLFKPERGHLWHVVHETATGGSPKYTCTLCSQKQGGGGFGEGTRKRNGGVPSCEDCWKLDDVFQMSDGARMAFEEIATNEWSSVSTNSRGLRELLQRDLVDSKYNLTSRGNALGRDFVVGASPLPDAAGVFHARYPLSQYPGCLYGISGATLEPFVGVKNWLDRYIKLSLAHEKSAITCIACVTHLNL